MRGTCGPSRTGVCKGGDDPAFPIAMTASNYVIAYASTATRDFTTDDLTELLATSRRRNAESDVTGLLLHRGGNFLQVLEGPEAAVRETMQRISRDRRHHAVVDLYEGWQAERLFGGWEMAFENADRLDPAAHPGMSRFLSGGEGLGDALEDHDLFEFLRAFRDYLR